jgi:hypothetical protein
MPLGTALRHQAVLVIQAAVAQISNSSAPPQGIAVTRVTEALRNVAHQVKPRTVSSPIIERTWPVQTYPHVEHDGLIPIFQAGLAIYFSPS